MSVFRFALSLFCLTSLILMERVFFIWEKEQAKLNYSVDRRLYHRIDPHSTFLSDFLSQQTRNKLTEFGPRRAQES